MYLFSSNRAIIVCAWGEKGAAASDKDGQVWYIPFLQIHTSDTQASHGLVMICRYMKVELSHQRGWWTHWVQVTHSTLVSFTASREGEASTKHLDMPADWLELSVVW